MCSIDFGFIRNIAQIIILNIGLYILDYALDINAYLYQKNRGHDKWANSILLVTFLPNIVGFIYECIKTISYVERYAHHKYDMNYRREWDWKPLRIYHVYSYYRIRKRKWEDLSRTEKTQQILIVFLKHFIVASLIFFILIPAILLLPLFLIVWLTLELLDVGITDVIAKYLDRHLYGWIIGYNRLADGKTHHKQQRKTIELLRDLLLQDRYAIEKTLQ